MRPKVHLDRFAAYAAVVACCGCGGNGPAAPSPPSVAGSYRFSVMRCSTSGNAVPIPMSFVCASQNTWTLSQADTNLSGRAMGECPPFSWNGTLTARIVGTGRIEITSLTYRDSSSHTEIQTLAATGEALIDTGGFAGMLAGEFTSTPVFGGVTGPVSACDGTQMAFRFSREP